MGDKSKPAPLVGLDDRQRQAISVLIEKGLLPELVEGLSVGTEATPPSTPQPENDYRRTQAWLDLRAMVPPSFSDQDVDDLAQVT